MRWYRHVKEWPRDIRRGVKNLIKWFPIIWDNHDWDHEYILKLLQAKLKFMIADFKKAQFHEGWENDVAEMEAALRILERILTDEYRKPAEKLIHSRDWGHWKPETMEEIFSYLPKNITNEEEEKQYTDEWREIVDVEFKLMQADYDVFFGMLARNMRKWWW